ncbi:hypothetical protein Rrhod_0123 [Rhodococcus rhodnii LMG 5362]|uniref:MFS transporter n=1 Tax=Rhodococcus rhodnii LMG 5362 TaxID=1273125 RepID=R7WTI4_9NOCA|nr:MFS transporter [Rhodococcus rhodnii]EOM78585.1 hypothetical protein Rrhod_0123 [Rhodococcus rhodnii LMG 5362]
MTTRDRGSATRIRGPVVAAYAAGSVGTGGFATLPGLVLAYYLTDTLGVAAALASIVVLAPKIIDVAVAPAIGALSDRVAVRTGSRARFMAFGTIVMPVFFVVMFASPVREAGGALWVVLAFTAAALAYSFFQVPFVALPAELTRDYDERTRLVSVRVAVLALTILVVGAGGPALRDAAGGGSGGYLVMAVGVAALLCAGMAWASRGSGRARYLAVSPRRSDATGGDASGLWREGLAALRTAPVSVPSSRCSCSRLSHPRSCSRGRSTSRRTSSATSRR